jgi:general secretion pathway protein E
VATAAEQTHPVDEMRPMYARLAHELGVELDAEDGDSFGGSGEATGTDHAGTLLRVAVRERATDVHLEPRSGGVRVRLRIDGTLLDAATLRRAPGERLIRHFKALAGIDTAGGFRPADARLTQEVDGRPIDLRIACVPTVSGEKLAMRLLDRSRANQSLHELGLADDDRLRVETWLTYACGMFLVVGPTGSGKTTTLYALLHRLKLRERSVATIEDPVEYQIDGVAQMQVDRRHDLTFDTGLRAMLRLDPDYLLLGEIRDVDAARAAAEAANGGRVLMSTLHGPDAAGAVTTLRGYGLADHEIAAALRVVVGQRLVRRLCPHCRRPADLTDEDRRWLAAVGLPRADDDATFYNATGCDVCRGLGYDGRVGVFEVWRLGAADCSRIAAHADEQTIRRSARAEGQRDLLEDGYAKAAAGVTSLAELKGLSLSVDADVSGRLRLRPEAAREAASAVRAMEKELAVSAGA